MKFHDQLHEMVLLENMDRVSVSPYLVENASDIVVSMLAGLETTARHKRMDCCQSDRIQILFSIWSSGLTTGLRALMLYGEPDDTRALMTIVPEGEDLHL